MVAGAVSLWLSALNSLYRDVRYALPFLIQLGLFVSPVVYPMSVLGEAWQYVLALNPLTGVLQAFRWCVLGASEPGAELLVSLAAALALLVTGVVYFERINRRMADVI